MVLRQELALQVGVPLREADTGPVGCLLDHREPRRDLVVAERLAACGSPRDDALLQLSQLFVLDDLLELALHLVRGGVAEASDAIDHILDLLLSGGHLLLRR